MKPERNQTEKGARLLLGKILNHYRIQEWRSKDKMCWKDIQFLWLQQQPLGTKPTVCRWDAGIFGIGIAQKDTKSPQTASQVSSIHIGKSIKPNCFHVNLPTPSGKSFLQWPVKITQCFWHSPVFCLQVDSCTSLLTPIGSGTLRGVASFLWESWVGGEMYGRRGVWNIPNSRNNPRGYVVYVWIKGMLNSKERQGPTGPSSNL